MIVMKHGKMMTFIYRMLADPVDSVIVCTLYSSALDHHDQMCNMMS